VTLSQTRTRLIARLDRRRQREREGLVLAEGLRVAGEALDHGVDIVFAVASPRAETLGGGALLARLTAAGVDLLRIDDDELAALAGTETPQGLLLVCREPRPDLAALLFGPRPGRGGHAAAGGTAPASAGPRLLVLDGVQDPGNAGTLIRTAAAFGLSGVIALDGTVDPWNPKSVRAAAGACFSVPVLGAPWSEAGPALAAANVPILVADARGTPVSDVGPRSPWALVVGSEGGGPRPEVQAAAARHVAVPMSGGTESLNAAVAGAILLYALTRGDRGDRSA
jgi:TrmH family RNA methyltransferase